LLEVKFNLYSFAIVIWNVRSSPYIIFLQIKTKTNSCWRICCSQFQEHFMSSFCSNILAPKKIQSQTVIRVEVRKILSCKKLSVKCWWNWDHDSSSSTFYEQLLCTQIPKAQKRQSSCQSSGDFLQATSIDDKIHRIFPGANYSYPISQGKKLLKFWSQVMFHFHIEINLDEEINHVCRLRNINLTFTR